MNDERRKQMMIRLLTPLAELDNRTLWEALDREVEVLAGDPDEKALAHETAGLCRLACASSDGRHLLPAFRHFVSANRPDLIGSVLAQARLFGESRAVVAIRDHGRARNLPELSVPDFAEWFKTRGVRWFDVYHDPEVDMTFVMDDDAELWPRLAAEISPDPFGFLIAASAAAETVADYPEERKFLLSRLAWRLAPFCQTPSPRRTDVDGRFRGYCADHGLTILRQLQVGIDELRFCAWVYLVRDADGIVKIFKEAAKPGDGRLPADAEDDLFRRAAGLPGLPRFFGTAVVDENLDFLKLEMIYGQSLHDYVHPGHLLDADAAVHVIRELAVQLAGLHDRGIVYLDLRPDNVLIDGATVRLFDLNVSRLAAKPFQPVEAIVLDPRFTPPETILRAEAGPAADVYQLGLVFHQLLTGRLPNVAVSGLPHDDEHRESAVLKFALANTVVRYGHRLDEELGDPRLAIIARMLDRDPDRRPTAKDVSAALAGNAPVVRQRGRGQRRGKKSNTVLFPARMGIPHRGHIDFITRLLDLGHHVTVSLQRSYTITDRDPLPKWLVAKMVARSLLDRGFGADDFDIILTPFFGTDEEHRLHFAMMPGREDVAAVASGNPTVQEMFSGLPIIDQRAVFGTEGEEYADRSWGEILRQAVKTGDYDRFREYAASGVEQIMPFDEIRRRYAENPVEFMPGHVYVRVKHEGNILIERGRLPRYASPDAGIVKLLAKQDESCNLIDPLPRHAQILFQSRLARLRWISAHLEESGDILLDYDIVFE